MRSSLLAGVLALVGGDCKPCGRPRGRSGGRQPGAQGEQRSAPEVDEQKGQVSLKQAYKREFAFLEAQRQSLQERLANFQARSQQGKTELEAEIQALKDQAVRLKNRIETARENLDQAEERLKSNLGLRRLEATIEINPRGDSPNAGFDHVRYLPGVSVTWNFLEDMNLRAAYSETYSLPLLTEIAPVNFTDPDSGRAFQGNPDLKPTVIKALDVRWEWCPSRSGLLTMGWFLKDYNNPIEHSFADLAGGDRTLNQMRNFDQADL